MVVISQQAGNVSFVDDFIVEIHHSIHFFIGLRYLR